MPRKFCPLSQVYGLLEPGPVVAACVDPSIRNPRTLHHRGNGVFMVAGETIRLPSKIK